MEGFEWSWELWDENLLISCTQGAKFITVLNCENASEAEIEKLLHAKSVAAKAQSSLPVTLNEEERSLRIMIVEDNRLVLLWEVTLEWLSVFRINQQLLSKYFQQSQYSHLIAK